MTLNPTCTAAGSKHKICTVCGAELEVETIAALGHDLIHHDAKAATCTAIGWNAYDTCSRCDYTTYSELPALGHTSSDWIVTLEPTCTVVGSKHKVCTVCDAELEVEAIAALGHALVHHDAKAATCTAIGWNAYDTCSRCDYSTYSELPALGHDYANEWTVDLAPTCTGVGSKSHHCTRCGEKSDVTEIPANGHTASDWVVDIASTCITTGLKHKECTICHLVIEQDEIALGTHVFGEWKQTKAPTCTAKGAEKRTCCICDHSETRDLPALGHNLIHHNAIAATCTEIGWNAYDSCSRCNYTTYSELPAIGHNYHAVVTAPTENERGFTTHTCDRCGNIYVDSYVPSLGEGSAALLQELTAILDGITTVDLNCFGTLKDVQKRSKSLIASDKATLDGKLRPLTEAYIAMTQSINEEYEAAEEIEAKTFTAALSLIQYWTVLADISVIGKRWF